MDDIKLYGKKRKARYRAGGLLNGLKKSCSQWIVKHANSVLTSFRALHPQADVYRMYVKRSESDRGMISIEECVNVEINSLNRSRGVC